MNAPTFEEAFFTLLGAGFVLAFAGIAVAFVVWGVRIAWDAFIAWIATGGRFG